MPLQTSNLQADPLPAAVYLAAPPPPFLPPPSYLPARPYRLLPPSILPSLPPLRIVQFHEGLKVKQHKNSLQTPEA
jgi:hypothetical protein